MGYLSSTFGNFAPKTKTLVNRVDRGVYEVSRRPRNAVPKDDRGPIVRTIETTQTFLTASEIDRLVNDYLAGASVNELAERYGVHWATVSVHLTRRWVARRLPGMGVEEAAEAVRRYQGGVSIRAISRSVGIGRKTVRVALVDAKLMS